MSDSGELNEYEKSALELWAAYRHGGIGGLFALVGSIVEKRAGTNAEHKVLWNNGNDRIVCTCGVDFSTNMYIYPPEDAVHYFANHVKVQRGNL